MESVFESLTALRPAVLYLVLALVAAVENICPPIPADTVVAFGAFLAARG
ncbi:MAG: DedA family protein, partial [Gemmatimonadaceae bacterium]|nr:DedA family protein [Gemmatimonadaceae bacterium]